MLLYADKIEEMKTICWFCEKKAMMALRVEKSINRFEKENKLSNWRE